MKSIKANLTAPVPTRTLPPAPAKSPELTPWFPATLKPSRVGTYQTDFGHNPGYSVWNGYQWGCEWQSQWSAERDTFSAGVQNKKWRGLASNPAKAK